VELCRKPGPCNHGWSGRKSGFGRKSGSDNDCRPRRRFGLPCRFRRTRSEGLRHRHTETSTLTGAGVLGLGSAVVDVLQYGHSVHSRRSACPQAVQVAFRFPPAVGARGEVGLDERLAPRARHFVLVHLDDTQHLVGDVMPALIFPMASSRSGAMPLLAAMRISASLARSLISFLTALVGRKNLVNADAPGFFCYLVPRPVRYRGGQPCGRGRPASGGRTSRPGSGRPRPARTPRGTPCRRASQHRWAITRVTDVARTPGSTPRSSMRVTAPMALLVCSVFFRHTPVALCHRPSWSRDFHCLAVAHFRRPGSRRRSWRRIDR